MIEDKKDDEIIIISDKIYNAYPLFIYLDQYKNYFLYNNSTLFYQKNNSSSQDFKTKIFDSKNKLIFINKNNHSKNSCITPFSEYYFLDSDFYKKFTL
jgi:hypothetical protein